jgi:hypothetical protein
MANPYTQDISKSTTYKKITGDDDDKFAQFLKGANIIKEASENKVLANIRALEDENVLAIQKQKLMLKGLNGVSVIQKDIKDNFNNDVNAWSRDYAAKELRNETISRFGLQETAENKIDLDYPIAARGEWLKERANTIRDNFNSIVTQLDSIGVPYKDLEKGGTFIDKAYQAAFNGLERDNKFNLINSMGSLFKGHGLGNQSASELREEFNKNISKNPISKLEDINNTFKALYATNPELAADYEDIITETDIKQNVDIKFGEITKENVFDRETGKTYEQKYRTVSYNYTDKDGNPQSKSKVVTVTGEGGRRDVTTPTDFNANLLYIPMLRKPGQEKYYELLKDYQPYQAFMKVRPEYGISFSELEAKDMAKTIMPQILTNWTALSQTYHETDIQGHVRVRADIQAYIDGKGKVPKPAGYYNNMKEYQNDVLGTVLDTDTMNVSNLSSDKQTWTVDSNLSNSKEFQDFIRNSGAIEDIKKDLEMTPTLEEELLQEFEAGNYERVDKNGFYFPYKNESQLQQIRSSSINTGEPREGLALLPNELNGLGLDSSYFTRGAKVGYNIKTKKLAFQPMLSTVIVPTAPVVEEPESVIDSVGITTQGLRAINSIPYLGAGTEFLFGDIFDWTDVAVAIPIGTIGAITTKVILGAGGRLTQKYLQKSYEKLGQKMLQKGYDPFKEGAKYGAVSGSGKSVEISKIGKDLLTTGFDPIKKGTAIIIGKTKTGKVVRFGGAATAVVLEESTKD